MNDSYFKTQIERLKTKFGPKAFDPETTRLCGIEVAAVNEPYFTKVVDNWIVLRKHTNPPTFTDFKSVRAAWERNGYENKPETPPSFSSGLKDVLRKAYKVDSIQEAFELERLKLQLKNSTSK